MDAPYVARPELNGLRTYIRRLDGGLWPPRHDVFRANPKDSHPNQTPRTATPKPWPQAYPILNA